MIDDFYKLVPKDILGNTLFREELISYSARSHERAREMWIACRRDPLFWINSFCWLMEPRAKKGKSKKLPFITYEFQDEAIRRIYESIEEGMDLVTVKSRDMGASWMNLVCLFHRWLFHDDETYLMLSRKEELVEKRGDHKALFTKIDFVHSLLPSWMKPKTERTKLHMRNLENNSTIDGESTNEFAGVADRRTAILLDEFSKMDNQQSILTGTRDVTTCRLFNYTPNGSGNASYDIAHNEDFRQLRLHWTKHPEKSAGLYYDKETNKFRSPWYDAQCKRSASMMEIAQELDIDFLGSARAFFDVSLLDRIIAKDVCPPYQEGHLDYNKVTGWDDGFVAEPGGDLKLWTTLTSDGLMPEGSYVIGADIAFGTADKTGRGASSSCLSGVDLTTGEKVLEFSSSTMSPDEFATLAVAIARWMGGDEDNTALLIWEANGPGRLFGKRVANLGFGHVWCRRNEAIQSRNRPNKVTFPGWWATTDTKDALLGDYARVLKSGQFMNRSKPAVDECRQYIVAANGHACHCRALSNEDPTKARENHGDRVISDSLCALVLVERNPMGVTEEESGENHTPFCFHERFERYKRESGTGGAWDV